MRVSPLAVGMLAGAITAIALSPGLLAQLGLLPDAVSPQAAAVVQPADAA